MSDGNENSGIVREVFYRDDEPVEQINHEPEDEDGKCRLDQGPVPEKYGRDKAENGYGDHAEYNQLVVVAGVSYGGHQRDDYSVDQECYYLGVSTPVGLKPRNSRTPVSADDRSGGN